MKRTVAIGVMLVVVIVGYWTYRATWHDMTATDSSTAPGEPGRTTASSNQHRGNAQFADVVDDGDPATPELGVGAVSELDDSRAGGLQGDTRLVAGGDRRRSSDTFPQASATAPTSAASAKSKKRDDDGIGEILGLITQPDGRVADDTRVTVVRFPDGIPRDSYADFVDGSERETYTDSSGKFRFDRLPMGSYKIRAYKDPLVGLKTTALRERNPSVFVEMVVEDAGPIGGVVTSKDGKPIAGAEVFPYERTGRGRELAPDWGTVYRTTTGAQGQFLIENLEKDSYSVCVRASGFAAAVSELVPTGTTDLKVVMTRGGGASGTVVDADTKDPVADIIVQIISVELGRDSQEAKTDSNGQFMVAGLRNTKYAAFVSDKGYVTVGQSPLFDVAEGEVTTDLEVIVSPGGSISGRVFLQETDRGIADVKLYAYPRASAPFPGLRGQSAHYPKAAISGDDGLYRIDGLATGQYMIDATAPPGIGKREGNQPNVTVTAGSEAENIDIPFVRGLQISGVVENAEGRGVEGAIVIAASEEGRGYATTISTGSGEFTVAGLSENDTMIFLSASKAGLVSERQGPYQLDQGGLSGIVLKLEGAGTITGRVVDTSGNPRLNSRVDCRATAEDGHSRSVTSSLGGAFTLVGLPAGQYTLTAGPPNTGRPVLVSLSEGEAVSDIQLVDSSPPGLDIAGRVTDSAGKPIAGVQASARGQVSQLWVNTDADGRYRLSNVPEGPQDVRFYKRGYSYTHRVVEAGDENADVVLLATGTVRGRVVEVNGNPAKDFEIAVVVGETESISSAVNQTFQRFMHPEGVFELMELQSGANTIVARSPGNAPAFRIVEVPPGESVDNVVIQLSQGRTVSGFVVDPRGVPLSSAGIYVNTLPSYEYEPRGGTGAFRDSFATSAADGSFTLDSMTTDALTLWAVHTDHSPGSLVVSAGSTAVNNARIALMESGSIVVTVSMAGGMPGSRGGATATLRTSDSHRMWRQAELEMTGSGGNAVIRNLMPGEYDVHVRVYSGSSYRYEATTVTVSQGSETPVDVVFESGTASITGTVHAPRGASYIGVTVTMTLSDGTSESFGMQCDPNGRFELNDVPSGLAIVQAQAQLGQEAYAMGQTSAELVDGQLTQVEITAEEVQRPQ